MGRPRIIVIDADQGERSRLRDALSDRGFDAADVPATPEGMAMVASFQPEGIVAGLEPGADGGQLLRSLRAGGPGAAVVVASAPSAMPAVVEALRHGAEGYLVRPVDGAQAALVLERALETRRLQREAALLREQVRHRHALVGATPEILQVREVVRRAAPTKATVLVQGENGTGRELVAQSIHEASPRRERPFVRVSCAGISEALVESALFGHEAGLFPHETGRSEGRVAAATGGTLFLHEVGSLPPGLQVKLLRLLQHGEYERLGGSATLRADVRVVAASARDLPEEVRAGRFRDDLYYRLSVVSVTLPPLRERKGDIPMLVEHFLDLAARARGKGIRAVSPGALSALYAYDWPGNVRELAAAIDQAVARCDGREIASQHLSPVLQGAGPEDLGSALIPGATLEEIEREAILRTLEDVAGSTARAAQVLGISVRKIQYKLKEYRGGAAGRRRRPPT